MESGRGEGEVGLEANLAESSGGVLEAAPEVDCVGRGDNATVQEATFDGEDPWPIDPEYDDGKGGPFLEPNEEDDGDKELQVTWMAAIVGVVWRIVGINVVWWMAKIGVIWRMDEDVLA